MKRLKKLTDRQDTLYKEVEKIMDEEILPLIAKLGAVREEESFDQAVALGNAYINAACILMYGLQLGKGNVKAAMAATVDSVWLQGETEEDLNGSVTVH